MQAASVQDNIPSIAMSLCNLVSASGTLFLCHFSYWCNKFDLCGLIVWARGLPSGAVQYILYACLGIFICHTCMYIHWIIYCQQPAIFGTFAAQLQMQYILDNSHWFSHSTACMFISCQKGAVQCSGTFSPTTKHCQLLHA